MRRASLGILVALWLGACGPERRPTSGEPGERPAGERAPVAAVTGGDAGPSEAAIARTSGEAAAPDGDVDADADADADDLPAAIVARAAALREGEAASERGDLTAALASYDRALLALPGEARALRQRADLRRRLGDLGGAAADLRRAADNTADRAVQAQIILALGEVLDAGGDAAAAELAYREADRLMPSKSAKARSWRSAAERACPFVDRQALSSIHVDGWVALAAALGVVDEDPVDATEGAGEGPDEAAAERLVCGEAGCVDEPPWLIAGADALTIVARERDGLAVLTLPRVAELAGDGARCERRASLVGGPIPRVIDARRCRVRELVDRCDEPGAGCPRLLWRRWRTVDEHVLRVRPTLTRVVRLRRSDGVDDEGRAAVERDPPIEEPTLDGISLAFDDGAAVIRGRGCSIKVPVILAQ